MFFKNQSIDLELVSLTEHGSMLIKVNYHIEFFVFSCLSSQHSYFSLHFELIWTVRISHAATFVVQGSRYKEEAKNFSSWLL
jgi:hypothetical protein